MPGERYSNDGLPFYCTECGCGFGEYIACEEPYCNLEDHADARARRVKWLRGMHRKKDQTKPMRCRLRTCRREFEPETRSQKYCSPPCSRQGRLANKRRYWHRTRVEREAEKSTERAAP